MKDFLKLMRDPDMGWRDIIRWTLNSERHPGLFWSALALLYLIIFDALVEAHIGRLATVPFMVGFFFLLIRLDSKK